jgi:hypothetical protein
MRAALLLLLLLPLGAHAQDGMGNPPTPPLLRLPPRPQAACTAGAFWLQADSGTSTLVGCENGTPFSLNADATAVHKEDGSIGDPADFRNSEAGGVDLAGTVLRPPATTAATGLHCDAAGEAGRIHVDTDGPPGARESICNGTAGWEPQGLRHHLVGGAGGDGAFLMAPGSSGSCSAGDCDDSCGSCTGTRPACTCTLTANSYLGMYTLNSGLASCVYEFTTFSLSGGTVTCGAAMTGTGGPYWGGLLLLRMQGSPTITGGTIDMAAKGVPPGGGGTSGGTGTARAGGNGGSTAFLAAPGGAAAGKNNGTVGVSTPANYRLRPWGTTYPVGAGGAGGAGSGAVGGAGGGHTPPLGWAMSNLSGATGGSSGGCNASVATGTGGDGGRGGGGIIIETAGTWACAGATLTVAGGAGASGKAGGAGGGAGGIELYYRDLGTDTCTKTTTGGAAASPSDATNCGTSGAGGAGYVRSQRVPY